jgi:putative membrane protein
MRADQTSPPGDISPSTQMAVDRTRMAHERTLLANVRTSTALISFGFTIYKFFAGLHEQGGIQGHHLLGSRNFGFIMVAIGVIFLALSSLAHIREMKLMRAQYGTPVSSLPLTLAGLISVLGILGLLAIIFRQ